MHSVATAGNNILHYIIYFKVAKKLDLKRSHHKKEMASQDTIELSTTATAVTRVVF